MSKEQEVDEKRLNAMKVKILREEKRNLKTQEKTSEQMSDLIVRIITDESKKNY